jgi:protoporphyrinogen oxidase
VFADKRIVIIGAGPTGLGAAWRLHERGHDNWVIYEAGDQAGGLASSVIDANGFTWDLGGHVLFSHYPYFDGVMDNVLGDAWVEHVREAWVWMRDRWIPYPFQNNVWRLPEAELKACLDGLEALQGRQGSAPPKTFREWLLGSFGAGICDSFLLPYNRKVWAYDPSKLNVEWMGERVATVDLERIRENVRLQRDEVSWGPNSTFRFPLNGGTGAIWRTLATRLPERIHFRTSLATVEARSSRITLSNGDTEAYDVLISTVPLDLLLTMLTDRPDLAARAPEFVHSSSHIIGLGLRGSPPADLATKCWIYFPEPQVPFYRATVFSNYSPNNAPPGHWSMMAEVSESPDKPVNSATIIAEVVDAMRACGFIDPSRVTSRWHQRLEHGYPTPWVGRNEVLAKVDEALRADRIFSRGRFGAWKYEVSNQDHAFMQGVEAVDHVLTGADEHTYYGDMSGHHVTSATSS